MTTPSVVDMCNDNSSLTYSEPGKYCPPLHDNVVCWPATLAGETARIHCRDISREHSHQYENLTAIARRYCLPTGEWDSLANYTACLASLHHRDSWETTESSTARSGPETSILHSKILSGIYFTGSVISLIVLLISLFIFLRFKSLQCPRTSIHKNLIVSFIFRFSTHVILMEPVVFGHAMWYKSMEWLCRTVISLHLFTIVANFCWMLAEGLFLYYILVLRPLNNEKAPFLLFYFIGWVIPILVTIAWAVVMQLEHEEVCWMDYTNTPYVFIVYAPILLALFINLLILTNLVGIVIAKLCSGHTTERQKIWRTIKSTAVLVLLLGIVNLLFFIRPHEDDHDARLAYRYINAILPNCQGIFVSLLYCGMNAEVRRAIKKRWSRFKDARSMHSTANRRRSSRTSMTLFPSNPPPCNGTEQSAMMEMQALREKNGNGRGSVLSDRGYKLINTRDEYHETRNTNDRR